MQTFNSICDGSSPVFWRIRDGLQEIDLPTPDVHLQYRSGRSENEAHRFLQENSERPSSSATCFSWHHEFDSDGEWLKGSRRAGRPHRQDRHLVFATCGARPDLSFRELSAVSHNPMSRVHEVRDVFRTSCKVLKLPRVATHTLKSVYNGIVLMSAILKFFSSQLSHTSMYRLDRHRGWEVLHLLQIGMS